MGIVPESYFDYSTVLMVQNGHKIHLKIIGSQPFLFKSNMAAPYMQHRIFNRNFSRRLKTGPGLVRTYGFFRKPGKSLAVREILELFCQELGIMART